ncbi:MAG: hypothetical protein ACI83O_000189 [Patescibacteria group bacterium]|jgi:uncharacterized protein (UPF0371 family)
MKKGFDAGKYIDAQVNAINERNQKFDRLYLEVGGHLISDGHASRVLLGYDAGSKIKILKKMPDLEMIYCINAKDLESSRRLTVFSRTYQQQALKNITDLTKRGLKVSSIVITRYSGEMKALSFIRLLERKGYVVYIHREIPGYSISLDMTLAGLKRQPYVHTTSDLVVITGPAGNSGKMAVGMSQVYHEVRMKKKTGYAKYETFPIWNLPLSHPINIAYEAATADLLDVNMFDPYHLKAYGNKAVNYNRDIDNFEILQSIVKAITKKRYPFGYRSPTDMGINMAKSGIVDDAVCRRAAVKEIGRREKRYLNEFVSGRENIMTIARIEELVQKVKK